ncbi:PAS domain S-box protein [Cytobacillus suaedae]|nr:PAS domain S-box protein [Cytobacillus suaedae]
MENQSLKYENDQLKVTYDQVEKDWLENEQMFKDLFHRSPDGILILNELGQIVDANPSFCKSLEMKKRQLLHVSLVDLIECKYKYKAEKITNVLFKNGKVRGDLPLETLDGEKRIFDFTGTTNTYNNLYTLILRDITDKRAMENELRKSEERFRDMFEHAIEAIIIWDDNFKIIRANESASRMFELSIEKLLEHSLLDFVKNAEEYQALVDEFYYKGQIRDELPFNMPNGEEKQLEFTSKKHVIDGYNMTAFRNVSERKRMVKELIDSELKFRKIFDSVMDGIILLNNNFKIIAINPVAASILEVSDVATIGKKLDDIIDLPDGSFDENFVKQMHYKGEKEFILHNGKEKIIEYAYKRQMISNVHMALFRDVTDKKEMEERLRKSDTLSVVGELAAGIAHEIRNPMTALKGFIHLLQASVKEDFSMYFDVITTELKRIESIITEFLILAKPQALQYEKKDLTKVMSDTIELLRPQATLGNVQIIFQHNDPLPEMYCEPNQLKQVFINIIKNGIEVMPKGGSIFVKMFQEDPDHLVISIADQGSGIHKDKLKRLGEPFYTTKDRGTGLGLMVSYKIIEEHKGKIDVTSEVGVGSVFRISLPLSNC